jgi:hypothetical protein
MLLKEDAPILFADLPQVYPSSNAETKRGLRIIFETNNYLIQVPFVAVQTSIFLSFLEFLHRIHLYFS